MLVTLGSSDDFRAILKIPNNHGSHYCFHIYLKEPHLSFISKRTYLREGKIKVHLGTYY